MINYTFTLSKRRKNNQFFRKTSKNIKSFSWGFPGGFFPGFSLAFSQHFHFRGVGSIPGWGSSMSCIMQLKKKKTTFPDIWVFNRMFCLVFHMRILRITVADVFTTPGQ